uniref:KWG Leptospira repeat protein n=1 Tax=Geobacter sp. (strain M21) TaxID=443144 RepID=C6DZC6_GEOSM
MIRIMLFVVALLASFSVVYAETLMPIGFAGKWGYVNDAGKMVVKPIYDDAYDFDDGLAAVVSNGKADT